MTDPFADTFDRTMQGLEAGLRVHHIATFGLRTCSIDDSAPTVLSDPSLADFDQIPVRDGTGTLVGVLDRPARCVAGNALTLMRPLDESVLIPSEAPLMSFIRVAGIVPYRLVLTEHGIEGIITRSDLLRLPVRLLAFAYVTHLETLMASVIRSKCGFDHERWLGLLSEGRRQKVTDKQRTLKRQRLDPALLELTEFCDKRDVVQQLWGIAGTFCPDMGEIEELRNTVAHAGTFIGDDAEARAFAERIQKAESWIRVLRDLIEDRTGA